MINKTKYILGLGLLFLFGFINYGGAYIIPIGNYGTNMINSTTQNYDIQITTNGTFLTQHLGLTKKLLYIYNPGNILQYAFWSDNGLIYGIYNSSNQGYFKQYFLCNSAVSTNWNFNSANCTLNVIDLTNYTGQVEVYKSFFGSLTTDDNLFYSDFMIYNGSGLPGFCVGNSSLGKSMCFIFNSYSIDGVIGNRVLPNLDINVQNFGNIESELLGNPPTINGGGEEEGGEEEGGNNNGNKNKYYCPTFKQILENQPNNYNTGLCYNGTLKYNNGQIETVQQKDIFTVFTDFNNFTDRIGIYNNNCRTPATQQNCENAFSGEREKYSIIGSIINNNVDDKNIWNYCNIWLNYDLNATTCTASGYIAEQPTTNELIEYIKEIANIGDIMTPNTGNVLDSLLNNGETREDLANRDIFGQLKQIKDKITSIFKNRNGVNGIIPDYILRLILTTLLLTVLIKK